MATLSIRNVPEIYKRMLEDRAAKNGRSMNNEAIEVLKLGLDQKALRRAELVAEINANAPGLPDGIDTAAIIREEREKRDRHLENVWRQNHSS